MRVDLDIPVHCTDGGFGELADVVIDPRTRRLTHLVVQPRDRHDARLVPIEGARGHLARGKAGVSLGWTIEEVIRLDPVEESAFLEPGELPPADSDWDVGIQEMYPLPEYNSLANQALGAGMEP